MQVYDEICLFEKGQCRPIEFAELFILKCEDGLNRLACTYLTNPTQSCQWDPLTLQCKFV